MSESELSRRCGMKRRQHLAMCLNKNNNSKLKTLCRIADGLGYEIEIKLKKLKVINNGR